MIPSDVPWKDAESRNESEFEKHLSELLKGDEKFRYQMLGRMRSDCAYYLGCGNRCSKDLWAGNEKKQIEYMKALWNSFSESEKPEWLSMEQILEYEKEMTGKGKPAILIELDYKGYYERYALTPEEFKEEFGERLKEDMPKPGVEGQSYTLRPMVHVWYFEASVGNELWNRFFTDMEDGLPQSDIESGNLAYIEEGRMGSLKKYLSQLPGEEKKSLSLDEKMEQVKQGQKSENRRNMSLHENTFGSRE